MGVRTLSIISYIQSVADEVVKTYDEDLDPEHIVGSLKRVEFSKKPLTNNINGFYKYISPNQQMIVVNENLKSDDFKITLFHELSHYFLKHKNTLLLNSSFTMNIKEEYQAELCGAYLYMSYLKKHGDSDNMVYPERICNLMSRFNK